MKLYRLCLRDFNKVHLRRANSQSLKLFIFIVAILLWFLMTILKKRLNDPRITNKYYNDLLYLVNHSFPDTFWHNIDQYDMPKRIRILNSTSRFLKNDSVVVIACCKDVIKFLPKFRQNVEMIVSLFGSHRIVLGESDSSDSTLQFIKKWARNSKNIYFKSYGNLTTQIPFSRTERIAFCRNSLLNISRENGWLITSRYLLVMDVDINANSILSSENFLSNFEYDIDSWAVMTASQSIVYYDIWALRAINVEYDCWIKVNQYIHRDIAKRIYVTVHTQAIPRNFGLIHVYSAFGGFGIYQTSFLNDCWYDGIDGVHGDRCEHVSFHSCIRKNKGSIFINSKFQNSDGLIH